MQQERRNIWATVSQIKHPSIDKEVLKKHGHLLDLKDNLRGVEVVLEVRLPIYLSENVHPGSTTL